jgi:3-(3-hydroxy-phenyl)propionate hydroxylase/6-hydroxy-3-succinoylpyridine 3-monooxygenase
MPFPVVHDWSVLPGLERLGVLEDAIGSGLIESTWGIDVLGTAERIDLDLQVLENVTRFPFNLHIKPTVLCALLRDRLAQHPTAQIEQGSQVRSLTQDSACAMLVLDGPDGRRQLRADWVVGADGTRSVVRRALGVGFPGFTWEERCVVSLIDANLDEQGYAPFTFQVDDRYGAVLQKVAPRTWIHIHAEPLTLPTEAISDRLPDVVRAAVRDTPIRLLDWRAERMHQRSADRYRVGRVLLAGEAAHVANRMIGHSPIASFFDAYRLIEALTAVVHREIDDSVLDAYATDRRRVFVDHASPVSASRKLLVGTIGDQQRLEAELEHFRRAAADPDELREMLLFNLELAGESPVAASLQVSDSEVAE